MACVGRGVTLRALRWLALPLLTAAAAAMPAPQYVSYERPALSKA